MLLSVVIPSFNEEKTIGELIKRVLSEKTPKEIIFVDDGSTDETLKIVQSSILRLRSGQEFKVQNHSTKFKVLVNKTNKGKGYSVRKGIKEARGDVLIIQDADLEYDPRDYQKLLKPIVKENADVVYGSRLRDMKLKLLGKDKTPLPLHFLTNKVLSGLTNLIYNSKVTDMETCYKMMTKKVYKNLALTSNRFEIEPEITAKIFKMGYKIAEVSIQTKPRNYKEGKKIKARDAVIAVLTLIRYAF